MDVSFVSQYQPASGGTVAARATAGVRVQLPVGLVEALRDVARGHETTLEAILVAGFAALVARWTDEQDIVVTVEISDAADLVANTTTPSRETCSLHVHGHELFAQLARRVGNPPWPSAEPDETPDLKLVIGDVGASVDCELGFGVAQSGSERVARMKSGWEALLLAVAASPQERVQSLPIMSTEERDQVLQTFNGEAPGNGSQKSVHAMFERQVEHTPAALAISCGKSRLTYSELNRAANQLARYLTSLGVGTGEVVGLCVDRDIDMAIGMIAILKASGVYLPLDPSYPLERLSYFIRDAAPRVVLAKEKVRAVLPEGDYTAITMEEATEKAECYASENLSSYESQAEPRDLAYLIYTSGSTGDPKGVEAEHGGMVNRILAHADFAPFSDSDRCCHKTSIGFVDSIFELLGPLSYGRPVVIASAEEFKDVERLTSLIEREHITQLVSVPSLAQTMISSPHLMAGLRGLRGWTLSGEELNPGLLRALRDWLPECTFRNIYGSSEVAADVTCYESDGRELDSVPIGRPISNTRIYILDEHLQPVPIGVTGEIYVGGVAVARGYRRRPVLTAERFVADPFSAVRGAKLFKTGDLGRWTAAGIIESLGRRDRQVKIRGFRIELGEIEAHLLQDDLVRQAAVIAYENSPGLHSLVAYVTLHGEQVTAGESLFSVRQAIRSRLGRTLPEYMIPSGIVVLDSLPHSPTGKLDRRALPPPNRQSYSNAAFEAPRGEVERVVARIWEELLGVNSVGRRDQFFELGGHSLLIVTMLERLRSCALYGEVRAIYMRPTLSEFAEALKSSMPKAESVASGIVPDPAESQSERFLAVGISSEHLERVARLIPGGLGNIEDIYPLSPLQEGVLFHHFLGNQLAGDTYVLPILLSFRTQARLEAFVNAVQSVVDRHQALRAAVVWEDLARPLQVVQRHARVPMNRLELAPERDILGQLRDAMRPDQQRIDLHPAPLLRLHVALDLRQAGWYVVLQVHHLICDNESLEILLSEVAAIVEGRAADLARAPSYGDFIAGATGTPPVVIAEDFFRRKLEDVENSTAPFGILETVVEATHIRDLRQKVDAALADRIRAQARRLGTSTATLFHAAWGLVVARTSSQDDVVFGTVLSGRLQGVGMAKGAIGMLINTLPLRLKIGDLSVLELVESVQNELAELLPYTQTSLAVAQRCSGVASGAPLFTSLLNYFHVTGETGDRFSSHFDVLSMQSWSNYPIVLSVEDDGAGFTLQVQTDYRIDPHRVGEYVRTILAAVVEAVDRAPDSGAMRLQMLSDRERREIVQAFNAFETAYPNQSSIQERFEEIARKTPDSVAVVSEAESLTYTELNAKANQLARFLRESGVETGEFIPVRMYRSISMVVAQLAVLKCGGVYVPLDAQLPKERAAFLLRDCGARKALTWGDMPTATGDALQWLDCAAHAGVIGRFSTDDLGIKSQSQLAAYIMYTSGSTGTPKGVVVPHRAVLRLVINTNYVQVDCADCVAHTSNPAFDASTFEIWGALLNGARLLVVPQEVVLDASEFAKVLVEQSATVLWITVGLLAQYAESLAEVFPRLRCLITGGDVVEPSLVARVFRNGPPLQFLNAYGPTECTTFSTTYRVDATPSASESLPIGRPISNTRIHILDSRRQVVPVGVAGEIYIGGDGVALGYLNRTDLTSERFVQDSFSTESNGKIYKTGDLARWRMDGNIEFLGRNDQQVKIRGFRVELGEIETQLLKHPSVKEAAIIVREGDGGQKRVLAYVVCADCTDHNERSTAEMLHRHLANVLPEYMLPSAFVVLERLPLTVNGKVDRRALVHYEHAVYFTRNYVAPENQVEKALAAIWQDLLSVPQVGRHDHFFDLGGHSLLALRAVLQINKHFGVSLNVVDLYQKPTLVGLARRISGEEVVTDLVNLNGEAALGEEIRPLPGRVAALDARILLTGSTGFVGRFLLAELLRTTSALVYCLVRARSTQEALSRVRSTLMRWDLWVESYASRIIPIQGDVGVTNLGLSESRYRGIAGEVDSIYHCATSMNHLQTYSMAKQTNVDAIRRLLELTVGVKPKCFNYISTVSVFSSLGSGRGRIVDETTSIDEEQHPNSDGYAASKWVGEKLVTNAADRGIPANVFRLGLVGPDAEGGRYDELQREYRMLKSSMMMGSGIRDYIFDADPAPVDYVARAIVFLSDRHRDGGGLFHIAAPNRTDRGLFERCNDVAGSSLRLISFFDWICELKRLHHRGWSLPAVPLVEFAFSMSESGFQEFLENAAATRVHVDCTRTRRELEQIGVPAMEFDDAVLRKCIRALFERDTELTLEPDIRITGNS
jgi:amino acid adenylation domain-containing protein/thioester reductase-like protein